MVDHARVQDAVLNPRVAPVFPWLCHAYYPGRAYLDRPGATAPYSGTLLFVCYVCVTVLISLVFTAFLIRLYRIIPYLKKAFP